MQYTPLKGVGGAAAHIYPPMAQWQVPRLGLNRLVYLLWALHTLCTPVVTNSVPALMTHLLPLLLRHFDGWSRPVLASPSFLSAMTTFGSQTNVTCHLPTFCSASCAGECRVLLTQIWVAVVADNRVSCIKKQTRFKGPIGIWEGVSSQK